MVARVRGYNQAGHSSGTSLFVPFHASTQDGDTVIIGSSDGVGSSLPSGWTNIVSSSAGSFIRYRFMYKVVNSTDVSTGGVTVSHSSGQFMAMAVTIRGATGAPSLTYNVRDSNAGGLTTGVKSATGFNSTAGSLGVYVGHAIYNTSPTAPTINRGDAGTTVGAGTGASRMQCEVFNSALTGQIVDYTYSAGTLQGYAITQALVPGAAPNPPTVPTSLSVTGETTTALTLNWAAPSGGGSVEGYKVRIDGGTPIDVGLVLTHDFTGLAADTTYTLEVLAYNEDGDSAWEDIEGTTDEMPPVVVPVVAPTGTRLDPLLSVRIVSAETGQDVHVEHKGLTWEKVGDGGWQSVEAVIRPPAGLTLGANDRIYIYDRTGTCVMEGYLDNPAQVRGPAGQWVQVTASGPAALSSDAAYPVIVIDSDISAWDESRLSSRRAQLSETDTDTDVPALQVAAPEGPTIGTSFRGVWQYRGLLETGQRLGRITYSTISEISDSDYRLIAQARDGIAGSATGLTDHAADTSAADRSANAESSGYDVAELRVNRVDTSITGAETHTFQFYDMVVRAVLLDVFGDEITSGYGTNDVYPHQVVTDMVGRGLLPGIDPARCSIDSDTTDVELVDQFAYPAGVTGRGAMDALAILAPSHTWQYRESNADGHSFAFQKWGDDEPTYVFGPEHGITTPGSDLDLVNRVNVVYSDRKGRPRSVTVTSSVPRLGSRVRDFQQVNLPGEFGTRAKATQVGNEILDRISQTPAASSAAIRGPVLNLKTGRMEQPWQLEAGCTAILRDTGQVGRVTSVRYEHQPNRVAVVTIGQPPLVVEELLAELTKRGPITPGKANDWATIAASKALKSAWKG